MDFLSVVCETIDMPDEKRGGRVVFVDLTDGAPSDLLDFTERDI